MKIDEIDHVFVHEPVDEVAHNATAKQPEAHLRKWLLQPQSVPPEIDGDERSRGEHRQRDAAAREHAPRGTRVADVNDVEETADDLDVAAQAVRMHRIEWNARHDPNF